MHAKDWTHTDIKPWNLCFGPEGDGLFIDLANACKVGRRTSCTTKEFFPGTSDEITFFTAHPKYDVFAFGKTLASIFCNTEHSALKHNHLDSRDYIDLSLIHI